MNLEPTPQQIPIINDSSSCVIIAQPGSGKTFILSEKIKNVLKEIEKYKGIIAISFTNKASNELKRRCLDGGIDKKNSFFGTIDRFFISEIVIPFGRQLFNINNPNVEIYSFEEAGEDLKEKVKWFNGLKSKSNLDDEQIECLRSLFNEGTIVLETVGSLALYIIEKSLACHNYIKARYSHIYIDEYQDSDEEQHTVFLRLRDMGLCCVAVGDLNQSIFGFDRKDSKFLKILSKKLDKFNVHNLSINHRCHPSIIAYSNQLSELEPFDHTQDDIRVLEKIIDGSEIEVAQWMGETIDKYIEKYNVDEKRKVAILVKNNRTGNIISDNIGIKHKYFKSTLLDQDSSIWSSLFREVLSFLYDKNANTFQFLRYYLDPISNNIKFQKIYEILKGLKEPQILDKNKLQESLFTLAITIYPNKLSKKVMNNLDIVINDDLFLNSYKPAKNDEVQIMTLYKSKGLEFDIVFHLDLYKYILPRHKTPNLSQEINLHYVGITRAKQCCILCSSTKRHNPDLAVISAEISPFMQVEELRTMRLEAPY